MPYRRKTYVYAKINNVKKNRDSYEIPTLEALACLRARFVRRTTPRERDCSGGGLGRCPTIVVTSEKNLFPFFLRACCNCKRKRTNVQLRCSRRVFSYYFLSSFGFDFFFSSLSRYSLSINDEKRIRPTPHGIRTYICSSFSRKSRVYPLLSLTPPPYANIHALNVANRHLQNTPFDDC